MTGANGKKDKSKGGSTYVPPAEALTQVVKKPTGDECDKPPVSLASLEITPMAPNAHMVKNEVANLEGRKLLQQNITMLYGVSDEAATQLQRLKITSIFDLAMSHYFNSALRLVDPSSPLEEAFVQHGFIPGDTVQKDPSQLKIDALANDNISELNFGADINVSDLAQALHVKTIRDMALWPPFQNARRILISTFDPLELTRRGQDPEAPADLIPASGNFPTECVYYTSVYLDEIDKSGKDLIDLRKSGGVGLFSEGENVQGFDRPALGAILTYKQSWYAQGVTLGQLLHSLALSPGESTRIAMVDWYRRTGEKVSEEIAESDVLSETSQQSRSISEITRAVAREMQHGSNQTTVASKSKQYGGSVGLGFLFQGSGGGSSSSSISTSVSNSFGQRNMAAEMNQNILSSTQQNATAERSRRATIVRECYQEEKETLNTRVVANYNHMHALTVQYYEVVQVYRVKTEVWKAERVLFVPMKPVNFRDPRVITRYRELLKQVAVNEEIRNRLNSFNPRFNAQLTFMTSERVLDAVRNSVYQSVPAFDQSISLPGLDLKIPFDRNAVASAVVNSLNFPESIKCSAAASTKVMPLDNVPTLKGIQCRSDVEIAAIRIMKVNDDVPEIHRFEQGTFDVAVSCAIPIVSIREIYLDFKKTSIIQGERIPSWINYSFVDNTGQESAIQVAFEAPAQTQAATENVHSALSAASNELETIPVLVMKVQVDSENQDLIQHLEETPHYSQAIWLSLDSLTISRMLASYTYGSDGKSLAAQIDPAPVAITGNYLGFRWNSGDETETSQWQKDVLESSKPMEAEIPLPSGGVFAEAVLGRYNSAEKLDITRFWNWQDSPIPLVASEIAALTAGGKSEASTLTPGQLSQPAVTINALPNLPDPTGMQSIMQAMTAANMFRDMSNQAATAALATQGLQTAEKGASNAVQQSGENMRTYIKMVGDVAKTVIPLVATKGLSAASMSKAGAAANLASKIDEKKSTGADGDATGSLESVLSSVLGVAKPTEKTETEEAEEGPEVEPAK